ncbi:MAG: hypothetical protein WC829_03190 [Hyphomicrobium sp.]|jgi:hypothetical protein
MNHSYFSGASSAARLNNRWDTPECGHGTCAAAVDCTGPCRLKEAVIGLPVIDEKFLDSQLQCDMQIEMIEPIPSVMRGAEVLKTAALVVAFFLVLFMPVLVSLK